MGLSLICANYKVETQQYLRIWHWLTIFLTKQRHGDLEKRVTPQQHERCSLNNPTPFFEDITFLLLKNTLDYFTHAKIALLTTLVIYHAQFLFSQKCCFCTLRVHSFQVCPWQFFIEQIPFYSLSPLSLSLVFLNTKLINNEDQAGSNRLYFWIQTRCAVNPSLFLCQLPPPSPTLDEKQTQPDFHASSFP